MKVMYYIVGDTEYKPATFNRVGYYKQGNKSWYEFLLPDGRYHEHVESNTDMFDFTMNLKNAENNPLSDSQWEMVSKLITQGILKNEPRWAFEKYRRDFSTSGRLGALRLLQFKKRVAKRKEDIENGKSED